MTSPAAGSRALHWVLKIGNLKTSLDFYGKVLGMKVLRHEEFETGCEATCNGPYGGAWSKTMIGFGPEESNFALELTYNYGINVYANGDDLQYICLQLDVESTRAKAESEGFSCSPACGGSILIAGPDGYNYKIVPPMAERAERFVSIGLRVSDLPNSLSYWCDLQGMTTFVNPAPPVGAKCPNETVGYAEEQVKLDLLQLTDLPKGTAVDHGHASGRIAFACEAVPPIHTSAAGHSSGTVITPPLTLPTPGKADVVVTILGDPDGYEICYVEAIAFYQLAEPTYDVIDFTSRATRGGDGAPPPTGEKLEYSSKMTPVTTPEEVEAAVEVGGEFGGFVLLDFGAGWCKNCKKMVPAVEELMSGHHASRLRVLTVDIDEAQELADEYGVSAVPCFVALKGGSGEKCMEYKGSDARLLKDNVNSLLS